MSDYSKFGVPLDGANLGMLMPKASYRFRVIFKNIGNPNQKDTQVLTQNVKKASRPKVQFAEIEQHAYNSKAYFAGRHKWEDITVSFYDDMSNGVVSILGAQIQKQMNHIEQTSSTAGANYKFSMEIHTLDGTTNEEIEKWVVSGCWISQYTTPEGDYSSDSETMEASITIKYDTAIHKAGLNTNGGNTVGGNPMPGGLLSGFGSIGIG